MAPSTYYAAKSRAPSARACRDAVLGPALVQLWKDNYCVYGEHKLWKTARRAGHDVGRDQVARLMRAAGIEGVRRGKRVRTTKPDPGAGRDPNSVTPAHWRYVFTGRSRDEVDEALDSTAAKAFRPQHTGGRVDKPRCAASTRR